jgi:hypothetical protein
VNGDTAASLSQPVNLSTTATAASPVGSYPIVAAGASSPNYTIAHVDGTLTVTITPQGLTLTSPQPGAQYCPDATPIFSAEVSGSVPAGSQIDFLVNDTQMVASVSNPPYMTEATNPFPSAAYTVRAQLLDQAGVVLAESPAIVFTVLDFCNDVAIVGGDAEIGRMLDSLNGDAVRPYVKGVDVFDHGQVSLDALLRYKLIIWASPSRAGEGVTDAEVVLLARLRAAGKSIYFIGQHVASDTALLSDNGRSEYESLIGLRAAAPAVPTGSLEALPSGYGDQICAGRFGVVGSPFVVTDGVATGTVLDNTTFQVKATLAGDPVMVVTPAVCELDSGEPRLATQTFGLGDSAESQRLFLNSVIWLLRAWYCEYFQIQLTTAEAPTSGRQGQELAYVYMVRHDGACAATGVTFTLRLPEGWLVKDVGLADGTWIQIGSTLSVTLGCLYHVEQPVHIRLLPTQAGTFQQTAQIRAQREEFDPVNHEVQVTTVIEPADLAPRLELHTASPTGGYVLHLTGAERSYRIQLSPDLRNWEDFATVQGPDAQLPVAAAPAGSTGQYFRALWP